MVTRSEVASIDIDQIFTDAIEDKTQQDRLRHEADANEVKKLYRQFITSGKPLATFARSIQRDASTVRRSFLDYRLPIIEITGQDIEILRDEAKRRNGIALCSHEDCLMCKLFRDRVIG